MSNRLSALIWLRFKLFTVNKALLFELIAPFLFAYFYKYLYSLQDISTDTVDLLGQIIPFSLAIGISVPIISILAEEREKKTLSALMLSGVRYFEYIVSLIIVSLTFSLMLVFLIPLILETSSNLLNVNYFVSSILMALSVCLLSSIAGLLAKTQVMGQVISLPVMLIVSFLPLLAPINDTCKQIVNYSFISLFYKYTQKPSFDLFSNLDKLGIVLVWIILLTVLNYVIVQLYRRDSKGL